MYTISAKWSKLETFFTSLTHDLHNSLQITIQVMYSVPAVLNELSTIILNNKRNVGGLEVPIAVGTKSTIFCDVMSFSLVEI